eukprot:gene4630-8589_t
MVHGNISSQISTEAAEPDSKKQKIQQLNKPRRATINHQLPTLRQSTKCNLQPTHVLETIERSADGLQTLTTTSTACADKWRWRTWFSHPKENLLSQVCCHTGGSGCQRMVDCLGCFAMLCTELYSGAQSCEDGIS